MGYFAGNLTAAATSGPSDGTWLDSPHLASPQLNARGHSPKHKLMSGSLLICIYNAIALTASSADLIWVPAKASRWGVGASGEGVFHPLTTSLQFKVRPGNYLACPGFTQLCSSSLHMHTHTHTCWLSLCLVVCVCMYVWECVCFGVLMSHRQALRRGYLLFDCCKMAAVPQDKVWKGE